MELYTAAISQLEAALWFRQTANELAARLKAAPATLEEIRIYLETPLEEQINLSLATTPTDQTLEELESLLLSIEASATASQNEGQRGEESLNQARDRPNAFSQRINVLRQRVAEIETTLPPLSLGNRRKASSKHGEFSSKPNTPSISPKLGCSNPSCSAMTLARNC